MVATICTLIVCFTIALMFWMYLHYRGAEKLSEGIEKAKEFGKGVYRTAAKQFEPDDKLEPMFPPVNTKAVSAAFHRYRFGYLGENNMDWYTNKANPKSDPKRIIPAEAQEYLDAADKLEAKIKPSELEGDWDLAEDYAESAYKCREKAQTLIRAANNK